jgi:hypothetical protein
MAGRELEVAKLRADGGMSTRRACWAVTHAKCLIAGYILRIIGTLILTPAIAEFVKSYDYFFYGRAYR